MMIEVNLLPLELRRVAHTPLPRFLVIIIGTAVVLTVAFLGFAADRFYLLILKRTLAWRGDGDCRRSRTACFRLLT